MLESSNTGSTRLFSPSPRHSIPKNDNNNVDNNKNEYFDTFITGKFKYKCVAANIDDAFEITGKLKYKKICTLVCLAVWIFFLKHCRIVCEKQNLPERQDLIYRTVTQ